ncbi:CAP domain-containing protein [Candidatus Saccharibacteria bacterium]|nr:CAP domain-containing protein [Candidatus Saccharibacteria bacterium]
MSAAAAAKILKQTRMTILLSLNAVAIIIAGILIARAIGMNPEFRVVSERDDTTANDGGYSPDLLDPESGEHNGQGGSSGGGSNPNNPQSPSGGNGADPAGEETSGGGVARGELWAMNEITIFMTADIDICVDSSLSNLGDMYWQTSNTSVIDSFYANARTRLGYSNDRCRYPKIVGPGTTVITAGTTDGSRRDTLTVRVVMPPIDEWRREVLRLVNVERAKVGLKSLAWGEGCSNAATTRAREIVESYSHTRPNGTSWQTACPIPGSGGAAGENLAAGNTAVSPRTVVASWMNSPSHRANILDARFTRLAVGFHFDINSQYRTYWSQFFSTY